MVKRILMVIAASLLLIGCGTTSKVESTLTTRENVNQTILTPSKIETSIDLKVSDGKIAPVYQVLKWHEGAVVANTSIKDNILDFELIQIDTVFIDKVIEKEVLEEKLVTKVVIEYPTTFWWLLAFFIGVLCYVAFRIYARVTNPLI